MTKHLTQTHTHTHTHTHTQSGMKKIQVKKHEDEICFDCTDVDCVYLTCKKGTMPSRAMACNNRGAPVKLCSPAPQQEKNEPITMTQGEGQDSVPITRFPFTESPNLQCKNVLDHNYLFSHIIYLILNLMSNNLKDTSGDYLSFPFVLKS